MKCLICRQTDTTDGLTVVTFEREEIRIAVKNVPARICPNCGEAYVKEAVAQRLLSSAEKRVLSGEWNDVRDYE